MMPAVVENVQRETLLPNTERMRIQRQPAGSYQKLEDI